jgi:hypothetical protein
MKRITALLAALCARIAPPARPSSDDHACMAIERAYASQPYPFEWE